MQTLWDNFNTFKGITQNEGWRIYTYFTVELKQKSEMTGSCFLRVMRRLKIQCDSSFEEKITFVLKTSLKGKGSASL